MADEDDNIPIGSLDHKWGVLRVQSTPGQPHAWTWLIQNVDYHQAISVLRKHAKSVSGRQTWPSLKLGGGQEVFYAPCELPSGIGDLKESLILIDRTAIPKGWRTVPEMPIDSTAKKIVAGEMRPDTIEMVEFTWTFDDSYGVNVEEIKKLKEAFMAAFGQMAPNGYTVVRCRLDQFAKFLILRNNLGTRNGFKNLQPQLINVTKQTYDVSGG